MTKANLQAPATITEVILHPRKAAICPSCEHVFNCHFEDYDGRTGWIVYDFRKAEAVRESRCSECKTKFKDRNLLLEQGLPLLVVLDENVKGNGDWKWKDALPIAEEDVEVIKVHNYD